MDVGWIRKNKRQGGHGVWGAYDVARDEHGVWLYTPEGSRYRGTNPDGSVDECFAGQPDEPGLHVLHLVPAESAWWFGSWRVSQGHRVVAIDVCTPPTLAGNEWSYVDLELDLYKSTDGTNGVFDEDEFEAAIASGEITADEHTNCLEVAAQLEARLRVPDQLFDDLAWSRLDEAISRRLPPIELR